MPYKFTSTEQARDVRRRAAGAAIMLNQAFHWAHSDEGFEYWSGVRDRLDQVALDAEAYLWEAKWGSRSVDSERKVYTKWAGRRPVELRGGAERI